MSLQSPSAAKGGVAFEIDVDRPETPSHVPGRLEARKQQEPRVVTSEELLEKQKKAEERRKVGEVSPQNRGTHL